MGKTAMGWYTTEYTQPTRSILKILGKKFEQLLKRESAMRQGTKIFGILIGVFLLVGVIIPFGIFYAVRQMQIYQLKDVPAPPLVIVEYAQLGMTKDNSLAFAYHYETRASLLSTIRFYEDVIPQQGWRTNVAYDSDATCLLLERDSERIYIQIRKDAANPVSVTVLFPYVAATCTRDYVWNRE